MKKSSVANLTTQIKTLPKGSEARERAFELFCKELLARVKEDQEANPSINNQSTR